MVKGSEYVELKGAGHLTMWDAWGGVFEGGEKLFGEERATRNLTVRIEHARFVR